MELPGLKTFLVPVDGGEASRRAKRYAIGLAKQCGGKVVLFHALSLVSARISPEDRKKINMREMERISKVLRLYEDGCREAGVMFKTVIGHGAPADAIVDAARANRCDMIIMGSGGATGVRKFLGSLSDRVSARSAVPVVVVGDECACANSCGGSCLRRLGFEPVPNLQGDMCAC
jgi:nucleotide-binding universal stress UspA family protein